MQNKSAISREPKVTILMGIHNGARFLSDQLESILRQTHQNWELVCSDDCSTDNSLDILQAFAAQHPNKVTICQGPAQGFAENFLSLIASYPIVPTFTCFADQDDIWLPDKIRHSVSVLNTETQQPHLYCGRRYIWLPELHQKIASPTLNRPCILRNALVENVASGNTVMLNPAATALARNAARQTSRIYAHDWWLYLLVTAAGGQVTFDNGQPQILYRQHAMNLIGGGTGIAHQIKRKVGVLKGTFSDRISTNLTALDDVSHLLTQDSRRLCAAFKSARSARLLSRLRRFHHIAPYRQNTRDTISFWGAVSLGLI